MKDKKTEVLKKSLIVCKVKKLTARAAGFSQSQCVYLEELEKRIGRMENWGR